MPPTIADYYRAAIEAMKKEVENTSDADVLGRDFDEWCAYLVGKWGMEPIEFDTSRGEQLVEVHANTALAVTTSIRTECRGAL